MLVCNAVLRPKSRTVAAAIAEATEAFDNPSVGAIFAILADDNATAGDRIDGFVGQMMVEAASAAVVVNAGSIRNAAIVEQTNAAASFSITLPGPAVAAAVAEPATADSVQGATISSGVSPPLDAVASVTGAWSLGRNMLTSFGAGTRYTKSGTAIISLNDQTGNGRHFSDQGFTTHRPVETTAFPSSVLCADCDGAALYLVSAVNLSSFISTSSGAVVVSVIIDSVSTNSGTSYLNDGIIGDNGQYIGLHVRNLSGVTLYAYNYDGTVDNATTTVATGTPYVLMWRHHGGNLYISVNGGTEVSVASGNTSVLSNQVYFGSAKAVGCNCKIAEVFTTSDGSQTAALAAAIANMKTYIGA